MSRVLELSALKPTHPLWNAACRLVGSCTGRARYVARVERRHQTERVAACTAHARDLGARDRVPIPAKAQP